MRSSAKAVAFGGVFAALAVTIMAVGGMIPIATYVCPVLCAVLLCVVKMVCGDVIGWAWYGTVALLSVLLGPDKEAAGVFVALGYYPLLQPKLNQFPFSRLWKGLLFNGVTGLMYFGLICLFGMEQLLTEFTSLGIVGLLITLVLGNISFWLLDRVLMILQKKFLKG